MMSGFYVALIDEQIYFRLVFVLIYRGFVFTTILTEKAKILYYLQNNY